jgi:hypothetical protein
VQDFSFLNLGRLSHMYFSVVISASASGQPVHDVLIVQSICLLSDLDSVELAPVTFTPSQPVGIVALLNRNWMKQNSTLRCMTYLCHLESLYALG